MRILFKSILNVNAKANNENKNEKLTH